MTEIGINLVKYAIVIISICLSIRSRPQIDAGGLRSLPCVDADEAMSLIKVTLWP